MSETRKERRKRERAEKKLREKNREFERAKESRFNGWFMLILAAIGFSTAAVCGYRILYIPTASQKFEGAFVRLESTGGVRSHITNFVYVDGRNREAEGEFLLFKRNYHEMKRGNHVAGLKHGEIVVELKVNGDSRFTIDDYLSWHWFGMFLMFATGALGALISYATFKNGGADRN